MSHVTCIVAPHALEQSTVSLTGESFHHLFHVRRLTAEAELRLVDGAGAARWARVERIGRDEAIVAVGGPAPANEAVLHVDLWVAPVRPQRAAWLVEKATEVGVAAVRWLETARTGRRVTMPRLDRLRRVAASAVEQSHRSRVPEIGVLGWSEAIDRLGRTDHGWFLDRLAGPGLPRSDGSTAVAVLVGPEGGWSDRERGELEGAGATGIGLGSRVLRTETAAVAGAALLLCCGDVESSPAEGVSQSFDSHVGDG